jgi:NADH-quinone oxidoreductase subunit M
MPKLSAFFLFAVLSSLGLPMLNGFVGEYLILLGTYTSRFASNHWIVPGWKFATWAALGVILSACYLLWSYQRVFFGEITVDKNKSLPDASQRERFILVAMSVVILWMGIGSAFLTRRTAEATNTIRKQMESQYAEEGSLHPRVPRTPSLFTPDRSGRVGLSVEPATSLERSGNR